MTPKPVINQEMFLIHKHYYIDNILSTTKFLDLLRGLSPPLTLKILSLNHKEITVVMMRDIHQASDVLIPGEVFFISRTFSKGRKPS